MTFGLSSNYGCKGDVVCSYVFHTQTCWRSLGSYCNDANYNVVVDGYIISFIVV